MRKLAVILLVFVIIPIAAKSQDTLSTAVKNTLVKGLAAGDMNINDLWLPWDFYEDDESRLNLIKTFFNQPLRSVEFTKYNGRMLSGDYLQNFESYFSRIISSLEMKPLTLYSYDNAIPAKKVNEFLNKDIDSVCGFIGSMLIRQFIQPLIQINTALQKDDLYKMWGDKNSYLIQNAERFLIQSEESQNANVFELKAQADSDEVKAIDFFRYAKTIKQSEILNHGISLYNYLLKEANNAKKNIKLFQDSVKPIVFDTKYGRIAIGGKGNDTYTGDYAMIIDVGGNDKYIFPNHTKEEASTRHVTYIIDMDGDDTYIGGDYSFGGAFFGMSILIDMKGNDTYIGGNFSLGSGLFGVGILHDMEGNDTYSGKTNTEGAGAFGIGLLIDNSGNDSYKCQTQSQGFGFTRGFGALGDFSGNDIYTTVSPYQDFLRYDSHYLSFTQGAALGYRPIASGGIGILADGAGNDTYISDIYGQGTGYWYAFGALYDKSGDDRYQSYQYAQGSGIHLAFGVLQDDAGDDVYISHGVSQGCGHDVGFGMLTDEKGNDMYFAESLSLGGGNANAISILIDAEGNDSYFAQNKDNTFGYSDFRRSYGMIGLFADGGGTDNYGSTALNNSVSTKSTFGIFADMNINEKKADAKKSDTSSGKKPVVALANSIDSLFVQASAASEKHQYMVNPARDRIIGMKKDALPFLAKKLNTRDARERLALEYILPKIFDADTADVKPFLLDSLKSSNYRTLNVVATVLGKKKVKESLPRLYELLNYKDWRIRALAAQQIGETGEKESTDSLVKRLKDRHPYVKMRAAYSIGKLQPDSVILKLKPALEDDNQVVRNNAVQGLLSNKPIAAQIIIDGLNDSLSFRAKQTIAKLIPDTYIKPVEEDSEQEEQIDYRTSIVSMPDNIRETIYRSILNSSSKYWKEDLKNFVDKESNESLLKLIAVDNPIKKSRLKETDKKHEKKKKRRR